MNLKPLLCLSAVASALFIGLFTFTATAEPGSTPWQGAPGIEGDAAVLQHRLIASHSTATVGQNIQLAWEYQMQPEWHIYWQNAGDSGLPPALYPQGSKVEMPLTYPVPEVISIPPITNYGYKGNITFTTSLTVPNTLPNGSHNFTFKAEYLYCKDVCLPGSADLTLPLTIGIAPVANAQFMPKQQLPVALPGAASASVNGLNAKLSLPFSAAGAVFIPTTDGLIDDAAAQTASGNSLQIVLDNQATPPPTQLRGLILHNGQGYIVPATPLTLGAPQGAAAPTLGLVSALLFAFIAGLTLNLMPCVLPVLSLKLLSLVRHHQGQARLNHTLAYTGGVLVSFWAFAATIAALQAGGTTLGWGFHLQQPLVVAALALLMVGIALNFWGVFSVGESLTRLGGVGRTESPLTSAATGALAVIVATPCTVPFMGGALAYALTQSLPASLAIFTAMGLGMAAPFLLVAAFPATLKWLPKPGAWMVTFKHALGWPMLLTALWLAYVFNSIVGHGAGQVATFGLLLAALVLALSLWIYGQRPKPATLALVILTLIGSGYGLQRLTQPKASHWQPWSSAAVQAAQSQQPVFVDFTADWCLTCKVTEATVLNTGAVQALMQKHNVLQLQADWTARDDTITAELAKHGRKGVPLYLLYLPGNPEPKILPQLLTLGVLAGALE